jgi:hypothetical protein
MCSEDRAHSMPVFMGEVSRIMLVHYQQQTNNILQDRQAAEIP